MANFLMVVYAIQKLVLVIYLIDMGYTKNSGNTFMDSPALCCRMIQLLPPFIIQAALLFITVGTFENAQ